MLEDIALAYLQAYPEPEPPSGETWPRLPAAVREALGPDFVRPFADRLEQRLGIGVVRVPDLSTAYSLTVGGRSVIAVRATGNWFRENWDFAHELGHLVMGHHEDRIGELEADQRESAANAFAAELLLPAETLNAINWDSVTAEQLAALIWDWGVSIEALCNRLHMLTGHLPPLVTQWSAFPTQRLLRYHLLIESGLDQITTRMEHAAQRRFPLALQEAHLERVASGAISRSTLAWMLGIDPSSLEVDSPEIPEVNADDLAITLGL